MFSLGINFKIYINVTRPKNCMGEFAGQLH